MYRGTDVPIDLPHGAVQCFADKEKAKAQPSRYMTGFVTIGEKTGR